MPALFSSVIVTGFLLYVSQKTPPKHGYHQPGQEKPKDNLKHRIKVKSDPKLFQTAFNINLKVDRSTMKIFYILLTIFMLTKTM